MRYPILTSLVILLLGTSIAFSQIPEPQDFGQYIPSILEKNDNPLPYRIMFPKEFQENTKYPLVIFLHGAGERGNNNKTQLVHGSKVFQDSSEVYPAVVVFPQCPKEDYWATVDKEFDDGTRSFNFNEQFQPTPALQQVINLIDILLEQDYIDPDRLYLTGLSMGGMGTWELLWRIPDKIAAAVPICGGGYPKTAPKMVNVPIWAIHGVRDDVIRPFHSTRMVRAVQQAGGKAKITLYPEANHNSWDPAFAEPEYLAWMFSKTRH